MVKKLLSAIAGASLALVAVQPAVADVNAAGGYDISFPQCRSTLPATLAFSIVGVNGGRVWDTNACLPKLLQWAGPSSQLYINTGNPLPKNSSHWPGGKKAAGVKCRANRLDSQECSFVYGYLGAQDSYAKAVAGFRSAGFRGSPAANVWWLDVELTNSWRQYGTVDEVTALPVTRVSPKNQAKNLAYLRGVVHYLENVARVSQLGFYSTAKQWGIITGGNTMEFSDHPVWYANGQGDEALALDACDGKKNDGQPDEIASGFTGSAVVISQYVDRSLDLDVNVPCVGYVTTATTLQPATVSPLHGKKYYLSVRLLTSYSTPAANRIVTIVLGTDTYTARTDVNGNAVLKLRSGVARDVAGTANFAGDVVLQPSTANFTITVR